MAKKEGSKSVESPVTETPVVQAAPATDTQPEAQAQPAPEPAPEAQAQPAPEDERKLNLEALDRDIKSLSDRAAEYLKVGDFKSLAEISVSLQTIRAARIDLALDLDVEAFIANGGPVPEGRFTTVREYEGGRLISEKRLRVRSGSAVQANAAAQSAETKQSVVKSNLDVSRGSGDRRHAPAGWTTQWSFKKIGQTFDIMSLGGGSYHLTGGGRDVKGSGAQVLKSITGYEMDFYANTGLGKAGFTWTDEHGLANGWKAPAAK